jgi:NAD(P)-dependent dehydrogenase (short-subunit alcohol dehydrogenase family)
MKDLFSLEGKVIVITGATGLLGRQHAQAIAAYGGIPVLLDLDIGRLEQLSNEILAEYGISCSYFVSDITSEEQVKACCDAVLAKHGKIDGLVNNAANNPKVESANDKNFSRLENFSLDVWNQDVAVGLTGAFLCTKYFGFAISQNTDGGSIVNISSDLGLIAPDQRLYRVEGLPEELQPVKPVTYSVIKTGLLGLTRYTSTYWAGQNVRCNAICPGGVENNQNEQFLELVKSRIPMNRMARPDEYKGLLVFLLSDAASYVNGAVLAADGGRTAW